MEVVDEIDPDDRIDLLIYVLGGSELIRWYEEKEEKTYPEGPQGSGA